MGQQDRIGQDKDRIERPSVTIRLFFGVGDLSRQKPVQVEQDAWLGLGVPGLGSDTFFRGGHRACTPRKKVSTLPTLVGDVGNFRQGIRSQGKFAESYGRKGRGHGGGRSRSSGDRRQIVKVKGQVVIRWAVQGLDCTSSWSGESLGQEPGNRLVSVNRI